MKVIWKMTKKFKNPYLNLIESIKKTHYNKLMSVNEKIQQYISSIQIMEPELSCYKFYTHPAFNDKWYRDMHKQSTHTTNSIKLENPWCLFQHNLKEILYSNSLDEITKLKNITQELAWFKHTPRIYDWVVYKRKVIKK